jgi:AMIN domain-containing protein
MVVKDMGDTLSIADCRLSIVDCRLLFLHSTSNRRSTINNPMAIAPVALACSLALGAWSPEQTAGRIQVTLRAVTVARSADGATVVVEANGPLPQPASGSADSPPRIYLDFTDVMPGQTVPATAENPLVRRVRVAEHSSSPVVTRVVIDLAQTTAYRIDSSSATHGRIVVLLANTVPVARPPAQAPPATQASPAKPQPPAQTAPTVASSVRESSPAAQATAPSPSAQRAAVEKAYGVRVSATLVRLYALRPVLESIDRQVDPLPSNVDGAVSEFEAIGKLLSAIKPPPSREGTHALLQRACTMGARAVRMRQDVSRPNDPTTVLNAASAAAGALMMLDRANKELAGEPK